MRFQHLTFPEILGIHPFCFLYYKDLCTVGSEYIYIHTHTRVEACVCIYRPPMIMQT